MAQAVIGAIRVNLGMNSAEFTKGMKHANRNMEKFGRKMAAAGKAIGVSLGAVGAAAAVAFTKISSHADKMTKSAQKIGVPVDELSALTHAAELSGVSFAKLETGVGQFSRTISDKLDGMSSEGVRAFDKLGISFTDNLGQMKSTAFLLEDVADRFQSMPDGAQKTALAMQLFGKAGRDLIPMLNQGSIGLAEMTAEAAKLGLVISQDTGQKAERFNDNITRMQGVLRGVAQAIFANVLPTMVALSDNFVSAATQGGLFDGVIAGLTRAFNVFVNVTRLLIKNLDVLYTVFKTFVLAKIGLAVISITGTFFKLAQAIRTAGLTMGAFIAVQKMGLKGILAVAGAIAVATGHYDQLADSVEKLWRLGENLVPDSLKTSVASLFADISSEEADVASDLKVMMKATNEAAASFTPLTLASRKLSKSLGGDSGLSGAAQNSRKALRTVSKAAVDVRDKISPLAQTMKSAFGSWIDSAVEGTFSLRSALAELAKDFAKVALKSALFGQSGFGSGGGSGGLVSSLISSIFGGFRADGGPVSANKAYVVGERGPELIVPKFSGSVIPNNMMQMGQGSAAKDNNAMHVTTDVRVSVDDDGKITAVARSEARRAAQQGQRAAVQEVKGKLNQWNSELDVNGALAS